MLNNNKRLLHMLIAIFLCVSSLDLMAKSFDDSIRLSTHTESIAVDAMSQQKPCDEGQLLPCSSSAFIAIFQSLDYSLHLSSHVQKISYRVSIDSIFLDVPKPPPRLV